jgi:hypothetical protein
MRWRRKAWHRKCLGGASCIPKYLLPTIFHGGSWGKLGNGSENRRHSLTRICARISVNNAGTLSLMLSTLPSRRSNKCSFDSAGRV